MEVTEALANCGPWMPRDEEEKSWQVTLGYKFKFLLGGVLPPGQEPTDPCKVSSHELPEPSNLAAAVQVSDPKKVGGDGLRAWEWRRSLLSGKVLKRMREEQSDDADSEFSESDAKRPSRHDPPTEHQRAAQVRTGGTVWESPTVSDLPSSSEAGSEDPERQRQQQLRHRLLEQLKLQQRRQRHLKEQIETAFEQMILQQRHLDVDPSLL